MVSRHLAVDGQGDEGSIWKGYGADGGIFLKGEARGFLNDIDGKKNEMVKTQQRERSLMKTDLGR